MKPFLRRLLKTLAGVSILLALFHLVENWRGKHAWTAWHSSAEALGGELDGKALIPPQVPDAENFAAVPEIAAAVAGKEMEGKTLPEPFKDHVTYSGNWREGRKSDLKAWQEITHQDLDKVVASYAPQLEVLAEAAKRPRSRLLVDYQGGKEFPALLGFRNKIRVLRTRAQLSLQQGKSELALEDVLTGVRVVQHFQKEPHLISQLLRMAMSSILLQPVWEGLQEHRWDEGQLARLQASLEPVDLVTSLRGAWMWERIGMSKMLLGSPAEVVAGFQNEGWRSGAKGWALNVAVPRGWVYQNLMRSDQYLVRNVIGPLDAPYRLVHVMNRGNHEGESSFSRSPYTFLAALQMPAFEVQNQRMARIQSGLDQATLACALERHRLAKGDYPEALEALVPSYLSKVPHDVVEGRPLRYQRLSKETFRLYALGWGGKDDGGVIEATKKGEATNVTQGDWVWSSGR